MFNELPKTRKEAKEKGIKIYFTNTACVNSHMSPRRTASGACIGCQSDYIKKVKASGRKRKYNSEKACKNRKNWIENNPKRHWIIRAVHRAKRKSIESGMPFDLTIEYLDSIFPDKCPVFDTEFSIVGNKIPKPQSPSLDKIDANKGYVIGNVAIISMKANVIKQNASSEEIFKVAKWLETKGY